MFWLIKRKSHEQNRADNITGAGHERQKPSDGVLGGLLNSGGLIDTRTDSLNERIARIGDEREVLDRRMLSLEARYRFEFNALDGLLAQISTTGEYLAQQLDNLPGYDNLKK